MTPNPGLWAALIVALPLIGVFTAAAVIDVSQSRRDDADRVLATCMGLRLTDQDLIVGQLRNARRIPLCGLTVSVESSMGDVRVSVRGVGELVERRQPYSYAASGEAQMFATTFARLSRPSRTATPPLLAAA